MNEQNSVIETLQSVVRQSPQNVPQRQHLADMLLNNGMVVDATF